MQSALAGFDAVLGLSATKADELSILQVCFRAVVVYLILIGYVRFGKKRGLNAAENFLLSENEIHALLSLLFQKRPPMSETSMSALGKKQTCAVQSAMSAKRQ